MNYHDTVFTSLLVYPSLFNGRLEVDSHLFATCGNGYEWENGELIEKVYNPDKEGVGFDPYEAIKRFIKFEFLESPCDFKEQIRLFKLIGRDNPIELTLKKKINTLLRYVDMTRDINLRYNTYSHISDRMEQSIVERFGDKHSWKVYKISEYSKLVTFPDDIKPDWKEALYNFVTWCLENQNYLHENNKERQLEFLKNSKNKLEKL